MTVRQKLNKICKELYGYNFSNKLLSQEQTTVYLEYQKIYGTHPDQDLLKVFIVHAHSGRYNGHALVCAMNKKDAREACYTSWLENGVIDSVLSFKDNEQEILDTKEELIESNEWPTEKGQVIELEWGS